jgi:hypothetical protein
MILARINRQVGPFASADAAWNYLGDGYGLGMSDVDELNVFRGASEGPGFSKLKKNA